MPATTNDLSKILSWLHATAPHANLSADSRNIEVGDVFFAYPGAAVDGRAYIHQAVERGASAIVVEAGDLNWDASLNLPYLAVANLKERVGEIGAAFYGHPDADMFMVAVTGTNGKTSCTQWISSALSRLGQASAVIGTLGIGVFENGTVDAFEVTGNTTPDALLLQRRLKDLRAVGAQSVAIEVSSIGLVQERISGMHCDVALFTNLTRDHLDYHGDMAAYEAAKTMLFDWPGLKHAVINLDDEMGLRLVQRLQHRAPSVAIIGTTLSNKFVEGICVLQVTNIHGSHAGSSFHLASPLGAALVKTRLVGQFNVSNAAGIIGVLLAKGVAWGDAIAAAEALTPVPGRMQQMGGQDAPLVVIDYAHTPDALEKTLVTLRPIAHERGGQLWCVFGCGGDRDPGKRSQMGAVSMMADHVIVTSDNPRSESPAEIVAQIMQGMQPADAGTGTGTEAASASAKKAPLAIEDRAAAILWAVKHAGRQDVILLAGKGHEATQEIKGRKLPFLDADHAALALATRATNKGAHS